MHRILIALLLCTAVCACDLPRDADGTTARIRGGTLRVGIVENAPWVTDSAGVVGGVEAAFVGQVAQEMGARTEWVRGPEGELMDALKARELDLVVGGLTASLPWSSQVAFTRPFYTDTIVVGVEHGTLAPRELKGVRVAVEAGDPAGEYLRAKDAVPVHVRDLAGVRGPVAAPTWRLASLHRVPSGIVLHEDPHVLAAAPGENGWLVLLERRLKDRRASFPSLLRTAKP
ncbi:MAG TPA: transporter substrate-binding domain-containing protein [Longimicrobiaceae bacterium]|jgi:polar amino acid transport system substrate-binding protein|nr:transporter substrate-binding domain-containing protein [Longimicrobiaceae bacterium]